MNYKERDHVDLYYQLSVEQQYFVDELLCCLGDIYLNMKTYRLVTSSLFDCLLDSRSRFLMEAIATSAHIDTNTIQWQKLVDQAKRHGILSRQELKLYRSLESVSSHDKPMTFREYVDSLKKSQVSSPTTTDQGFSCTANTELGMDLKLKKVFDYRDIIKTLERLGCVVVGHSGGSHQSRYNNISQLFFTVVIPHGSDSKSFRRDQLSSVLHSAQITYDDFAKYYYDI